MKIWYQSVSPYRYDPKFDEFGKIVEEKCRMAARPGTEVYVTGVPAFIVGIDYKSIMYYHMSQIMNAMLKVEREGYDAFVIGASVDVGLDEGREMLSIPVVGMAQATFHMAAMLGERFAIVTHTPHLAEKYRQVIRRYGLESKWMGNYFFNATVEELTGALKDPVPLAERFKKELKKAVADGASVVIPFSPLLAGLLFRAGGMTNIDGATVLDPVMVTIKMAELFVDLKKLGIEVSRTFSGYPPPGKELLQEAFKRYAPVFKIDY